MAASKSASRKTAARAPAAPRMTSAEVMRTLEAAGTAQARKTYARHGAREPMFGVSFAVLKTLTKRIGVDHDLARELWKTGNYDAQNLAMKVADPSRTTSAELDRWVRGTNVFCGYITMLAAESPLAHEKAAEWLAAPPGPARTAAWGLVGHLAARDAATPDGWFAERVVEIEKLIPTAPNAERQAMVHAAISIGGRSAALRKAALAAAKRIGPVEIDHGDTACETPDIRERIEKMWAHAKAKGFESPAAQERGREPPRLRC